MTEYIANQNEFQMYILYGLFLCTSIITIFFVAIRKSSKDRASIKELKKYHDNRPAYNQFKVLPHDVQPLGVRHSPSGIISLKMTPTHFQQMDEFIFSIPVKAETDSGRIGFDIVFNALPLKDEDQSDEEEGLTGVVLELNTEIADKFLRVLADLFQVELSNKAQIVRGIFLFSLEEKISSESLFEGHEFILFFGDKNPSDTTPAIRVTVNLNVGEVIIEEMDPIFRPIIIDRLTFKPNIKS